MDLIEIAYTLLLVAVILAVTYLVTKLVRLVVRGMFRTEIPLVAINTERIMIILVWVVGILIAVETVGLRIDLILLILGLAGIACIVALKDVLQNLFAKYFSDLYVPMKPGDEILVRGSEGKIIGINPISTIILDEQEKITSIPNAVFMREPVVNLTQAAWKKIIIPIIVSTSIDLAEFESAVLRACNRLKMHWDEHFPPLLTTKSRDENNIRLELELMVNNPERKEKVATEMNAKIMELLQEFGKRKQ
jgi:small-conductance mechanosensitive channel